MIRVIRSGVPGEVVTLQQAKAHMRIQHDSEDDKVQMAIDGAVSNIDGPGGWLGRALGEQTLQGFIDLGDREDETDGRQGYGWRDCCRHAIRLPYPPLIEVTSIAYVDTAGASQTMSPADWQVINHGEWSSYVEPAYGKAWPALRHQPGAMTITWKAGYADGAIPGAIRSGLLLHIGHLFENIEAVVTGTIASELPLSVQDLLEKHRVFS